MAELKFIVDGVTVLVDADMAHLFDRFTWRYLRRGRKHYVVGGTSRRGVKIHLYLHRLVLGLGDGEIGDHINGDTLDNRRCNLRKATITQNNLNAVKKSSKHGNRFRGAAFRGNCYEGAIRIDGKLTYLGRFESDVAAAYAYDMASLEHHGEFGRRNFLPLVN